MRVLAFSGSPELAAELVSAGRSIGEVDLLATVDMRDEISKIRGASKMLVCDEVESWEVYKVAKLISQLAPDYGVILLSGDRRGRELVGLVASYIGGSTASDVSSLRIEGDGLLVERMTLGGKGVALERLKLPAVVAVQKGRFQPLEEGEPEIVEVTPPSIEERVRLLERKEKPKVGVPLDKAEVVIAVGRGFRKKEDLRLAYELAEVLGGVVGATRPLAADLKWMEEEVWIGISGVRVAPKLLIVVGASGQQQFAAGILDSKFVVAINNDSGAPIFQHADYGIVGDLYQVLPTLIQKLRAVRGG